MSVPLLLPALGMTKALWRWCKQRIVPIEWVKSSENCWLYQFLGNEKYATSRTWISLYIEYLSEKTNQRGAQGLWEGYRKTGNFKEDLGNTSRHPNQVRTATSMGSLYAELIRDRKPNLVVEFGTAFGVSGMYWLAGLEQSENGQLLTFEPNTEWAVLAQKNLSAISTRYKSITGTFEENIDTYRNNQLIDVAFIDAIHTSEFVSKQLELVLERLSPGGIVILDDIDYSDDMRSCWITISQDARVSCSAALAGHVGIVQIQQK